MTDVPDHRPTDDRIFDRAIRAGIPLLVLEQLCGAGRIELDGEVVTDPYRPAPRGTRLVVDLP